MYGVPTFYVVCSFLILKKNLKNPASNLGLFTTTIFILRTYLKRFTPHAPTYYLRYAQLSMYNPSAINTTASMKNKNFADSKHIRTNANAPARHTKGRLRLP